MTDRSIVPEDFPRRAKIMRLLTLISYIPLLLFVAFWQFSTREASLGQLPTYLSVVLWVVPLLLPLHGIIKGKPYTHAWANFILVWYFLHSLTTLYTHPDERVFAAIELLLTSLAFIGATGYARYQGRVLGLGLKKQK